MSNESIIDAINKFANDNFKDGYGFIQINNYKLLLQFMNNNSIPFDLDFQAIIELLKNKKISKMVDYISNTNNNIFDNDILFSSLLAVYIAQNESSVNEETIKNDNNYDSSYFHQSALKAYLTSLVYEPFTREEEYEMFKRLSSGDETAREEIILHNLRLVVTVAIGFAMNRKELLDLIQFGNIGLYVAVDKFDYKKGIRFSTYATYWIYQKISRGIADTSRMIRIPVHVNDLINSIKSYTRYYMQINCGEEPSVEEIAHHFNISEKRINEVLNIQDPISLNAKINMEDENGEIEDYVADENTIDPDLRIFYKQLKDVVFNSNIINKREKMVLSYRFGFVDGKIHTLQDIGNRIGVIRERVRVIQNNALRKLRNNAQLAQFNPNTNYEEERRIETSRRRKQLNNNHNH